MTHFGTFSRLRCLPAISWSLARWVSNVWLPVPLGLPRQWLARRVAPFQGCSVHNISGFSFSPLLTCVYLYYIMYTVCVLILCIHTFPSFPPPHRTLSSLFLTFFSFHSLTLFFFPNSFFFPSMNSYR